MTSPMHRSVVLAVAATVGVGLLVATLEWSRRHPSVAGPAAATAPAAPIQNLQIADAVRSLKLVTWQFDTTIGAESVSDKWYGDAVASVRAPVRYQYGVDLSKLRHEDVLFSGDGYVFLVPSPERIAVEVDVERLEERLKVSGARWKSQNQEQLDAARAKLAAVAKQMELTPEDAKRLRDVSREQLEQHLTNVLFGGGATPAKVTVRFVEQ